MSETKSLEKQQQDLSTTLTDRVLKRFTGEFPVNAPEGYDVKTNVTSALIAMQDMTNASKQPVLSSCTPLSIFNALMSMCVQGLSYDRKQVYFIPYGSKLTLQRSYQGNIALARRLAKLKSIAAHVIYDGDDFVTKINEQGVMNLVKHTQPFLNIDDSKVIGAYAVATLEDGSTELTAMTLEQIKKAWAQGQTKGNSPAHNNFTGEMAKKTVINRALKTLINSATEDGWYAESEGNLVDEVLDASYTEVKENANKGKVIGAPTPAEVPNF